MRNQGGKASQPQTFVFVFPEVHEEHEKATHQMMVSKHDIVKELIMPIVRERRAMPKNNSSASIAIPTQGIIMMHSGLLGFHIQINIDDDVRVQFMPNHLVKRYDLLNPNDVEKMEEDIRGFFLKE